MKKLRFFNPEISQDMEVINLNTGLKINTYIRKVDSNFTNLNQKANKIDKTSDYWGWHMSTWTYFPYTRDRKNRF